MKKTQWIVLIMALALIGSTAGLLSHLRANQKLGKPGVKTSPIADSIRLQVELPEHVMDYDSALLPIEKMVLDFLPKDTSFGQRRYTAPDGFWALVNVVLMGTDRTSLHKPQFCLTGAGWDIDYPSSLESTVHIEKPCSYDLPVMKLITTKRIVSNGQPRTARGIYVYWFVADNAYTAQHWQRMWWMAKDFLRTGVLQRWAYISCFAVCAPGQEDATFERMKKFISASVPGFQLTPQPETVITVKE